MLSLICEWNKSTTLSGKRQFVLLIEVGESVEHEWTDDDMCILKMIRYVVTTAIKKNKVKYGQTIFSFLCR